MSEVSTISYAIHNAYINPTFRLFTAQYVSLYSDQYESEYIFTKQNQNTQSLIPADCTTDCTAECTAKCTTVCTTDCTAEYTTFIKQSSFVQSVDIFAGIKHPTYHIYALASSAINSCNIL